MAATPTTRSEEFLLENHSSKQTNKFTITRQNEILCNKFILSEITYTDYSLLRDFLDSRRRIGRLEGVGQKLSIDPINSLSRSAYKLWKIYKDEYPDEELRSLLRELPPS